MWLWFCFWCGWCVGGCFWCVEEVYEKVEGVLSVYSGYSGGHVENPTYQEVVLGNTGHIEAAEINYDSSLVNEEQLVKLLFLNIDPFDEGGQFCDRGYSYKSAFFTSDENLIKITIFTQAVTIDLEWLWKRLTGRSKA